MPGTFTLFPIYLLTNKKNICDGGIEKVKNSIFLPATNIKKVKNRIFL
jgi:hypothetical protein